MLLENDIRPALIMGTKNLYEKGPNPVFFGFFQSSGNENGPDSYIQIRLSVSYQDYKRIWCPDSFAPAIQNCKRISNAVQLLLHLANNSARTQIHSYLCQECGGYRQGYGEIEVHSFLVMRKERTLEARSDVLQMLEVKKDRWVGRLDDGSPKVKWMRRVYPRVDYTQALWTAVMLSLGGRTKAPTLRGRHRRFAGGSVFHTSSRGLLSLLATQQKWFHHLQQQVVHSLIPHSYYIHLLHTPGTVQRIRWCTQQTVVVVVFFTLTDPLRIQSWSQDRRNQTKSNRESEISRESRHKGTDKKVASKVHRRDKIENTNNTVCGRINTSGIE